MLMSMSQLAEQEDGEEHLSDRYVLLAQPVC